MKTKQALLLIGVGAVMLLAACSKGNGETAAGEKTVQEVETKTVNLKLAHTQSTEHPVHKSMERFAELVKEKSNGTVTVEIFANGVLGDERKYIESLQTGLLDMAKVSVNSMENFEELYKIFSIPYAFVDMEHGRKFMNSEKMEDFYLSTIETLDIRGLTWYDAGCRNYYTRDKAILKPEDLQGLIMRVQSSQNQIKTIEAMGGSGTPVDWGELYTAIQQGVVDGADNGIVAFADNNLCEVAKHFSFTQHLLSPDILLIKNSVFENLSAEQQAAIKEAAVESTAFHDEIWGEAEKMAIEKSEAAGTTVYYPDLAPFREKLEPLKNEFADTEKLKEYMQIIEEMK